MKRDEDREMRDTQTQRNTQTQRSTAHKKRPTVLHRLKGPQWYTDSKDHTESRQHSPQETIVYRLKGAQPTRDDGIQIQRTTAHKRYC